MATTSQDREYTKPFAQWLQEQRRGGLHAELSDALADVTAAVVETGKQGSVTLSVKVKRTGEGLVIVADDVKAKIPAADRDASMFYVDDHGNLSRNDPRQPELPLKQVAGGASTDAQAKAV